MKSRRQNVAAEVRRDFFESIPEDLLPDILLRMSAKSIAKLRLASKKLRTILCDRDFTERFFTRSCSLPKLLFVREEEDEVFVFSASQPQDLVDENSNSSPLILDSQMKFEFPDWYESLLAPVAGLVCFRDERFLGELVIRLCNPNTGDFFPLPEISNRERRIRLVSFFGYDPVDKLHKVLAMKFSVHGISTEHQVLTFRVGELVWRRIVCGVRHCPGSKVICIDGVLYYSASVEWFGITDAVIVWFDVSSETFGLIRGLAKEFITEGKFFNYDGRFGAFKWTVRGETFELCVLQDRENQGWFKRVCVLPPLGDSRYFLEFCGVIGRKLVVLASRSGGEPFRVCYYNIETGTMRRAEIQGLGNLYRCNVYVYINHVENVKFMRVIQH